MPQCVEMAYIPTEDGGVVVLTPGFGELEQCGRVTLTYAEWAELSEKDGSNPFSISVADAGLLSGAIVALWCFAWAIRAVRKAL